MNSIDSYSGGTPPTVDLSGTEAPADTMSDPQVLAALMQLAGMPAEEKSGDAPVSDPLALAAMLQLIGGSAKDPSAVSVPVTLPVVNGAIQGTPEAETIAALFSPVLPKSLETPSPITETPIEPSLIQTTPDPEEAFLKQQSAMANANQVPASTVPVPAATTAPDSSIEQPTNDAIGDDILQTLNAQSSQQTPVVPSSSTPVNSPSAPGVDQASRIEAFVSQIADRILVTDPLSGQNAQVHIKIAEHILPGTELQLWRGEAGQLNVNFATTSLQSAQVLSDAAQLLSQRLNERLSLSQPVVVTVQSGDGGMPQDGRSRQYQSIYDMLAAEQQSA